MPSAEVVVSLREVYKDYRGLRPLRVHHLDLRQGESVALLGFDRVAAEVLVNLVIGAALPDQGDVHAFGTSTRSITDVDAWLAAMPRFGILSERVVLLESLTVAQNLALPFSLEIDPVPVEVRKQVRALADEVGLGPWLEEPVGTLGPGALQRARLGKALALGPRVLLAEHPLPEDQVARFAADLVSIAAGRNLALLVMTADAAFARAASSRTLTVNPATGLVTKAGGWQKWLMRR
jgi:putative ABC transport system ATP-binding protein